jgi:hypothetical protein
MGMVGYMGRGGMSGADLIENDDGALQMRLAGSDGPPMRIEVLNMLGGQRDGARRRGARSFLSGYLLMGCSLISVSFIIFMLTLLLMPLAGLHFCGIRFCDTLFVIF